MSRKLNKSPIEKFDKTPAEHTGTEPFERGPMGSAKPVDDQSAVSKNLPAAPEAVAHERLREALGDSIDLEFARGLISQIKTACTQDGKLDQLAFEFMLSVIKDNKPRDQNVAMLATQMAAVHQIVMAVTHTLINSSEANAMELAARLVMNLTKTFTQQLDALTRYRTGGGQQVTVQNVSVSEGGQAIVGNVTQTAIDSPAGALPAITDAKTVTMPLIDEVEENMVTTNKQVDSSPEPTNPGRERAAVPRIRPKK